MLFPEITVLWWSSWGPKQEKIACHYLFKANLFLQSVNVTAAGYSRINDATYCTMRLLSDSYMCTETLKNYSIWSACGHTVISVLYSTKSLTSLVFCTCTARTVLHSSHCGHKQQEKVQKEVGHCRSLPLICLLKLVCSWYFYSEDTCFMSLHSAQKYLPEFINKHDYIKCLLLD